MAPRKQVAVELYKPHAIQRQILKSPARYKVVACGRQIGKTTLAQFWLIVGDDGRHGALAGEACAYLAPTYKMAEQTWRELNKTLREVISKKNELQKRIDLYTGGSIDVFSLENPDVIRGRRFKRVAIDEAAYIPHGANSWNAVIQATLIALRGTALLLSTPNGLNWYYHVYLMGRDPENAEYESFRFPTTDNPYIDPADIEAKRKALPDKVFRQEYLAEFIEDASEVFRNIHECATATEQDWPVEGHQYYVGCDFGKSIDFSVFAVVDATARELVKLVRINHLDWTLQLGQLRALVDRFRPVMVIAEKNAVGDGLIDMLRAGGMNVFQYHTTALGKMALVQNLSYAFDSKDIRILPDEILVGELQAYSATALPGGLVRFAAPEGLHDDMVMALLLAWHGVAGAASVQVGYMRIAQ